MELEFQKALALEFVKEYCKEKNYSVEKLSDLDFILADNECGFFHPSDCPTKGLINDMETLPYLILSIRFSYEDRMLEIRETQYTKKYLL